MASLAGLGITPPPPCKDARSSPHYWPQIRLSEAAHGKAGEVWDALGLDPATPLVVMHPGSGASWKRWGSDQFARLSDLLIDDGVQVVLIEGPADYHAARQVRAKVTRGQPKFLGGVDVETLGAFITRATAYVGNDSGVSHLAAGVGAATIVIFGPTDPTTWGPRGPRVSVVRAGMPCMPCWQGDPPECEHRLCLEAIGADRIASMLRPLLERAKAALPAALQAAQLPQAAQAAEQTTELATAQAYLPAGNPDDDDDD